jgi:hypothetical protein
MGKMAKCFFMDPPRDSGTFLSLGIAWSVREPEASIEMMFYLESGDLSILF